MAISGSSALLSRLSYTRNVVKSGTISVQSLSGSFKCLTVSRRLYSVNNVTEATASSEKDDKPIKTEKVSKAMRSYLERAKKHDEFIQKETTEFNIGRRHLANMMGINPETITQKDINESIEYLFPSGLFDQRAKPIMKPPSEVFPPKKAAEFDESGRPFHSMFYTSKPTYYQLLYDIVNATNLLKQQRISSRNLNTELDQTDEPNLSATVWISKDELEKIVLEPLIDKDYNEFLKAMERLVSYPGLGQVKDLILKYRKPLITQTKDIAIPKLEYTAEGRPFIHTKRCMRKTARGEVTVWGNGSGKITINGDTLLYFKDVQSREQVIFPLIFSGLSSTVDVEATVTGGGPSSQAGAVRWGIAWSLRSFVSKDMLEKMRIAGLLKRDPRIRERKKPGQAGSRKKFTWKKR